MSFLRTLQQLLPRGKTWSLVIDRTLRKFFVGLAEGVPVAARAFIDGIWEQIDPDTTTEFAAWETNFGIVASADDSDAVRAQRLNARWAAQGGQGLDYIQGVLQAAGFPVYLHEWWETPHTEGNVVTNGRFAADSGWTKNDVEWTIADGVAVATGATSAHVLYQICLEDGIEYEITYEIVEYTSGSVTVYAGLTGGTARSAVGEYTETLTAEQTALRFLGSVGGATLKIDNVDVRQVREARDPRDYVDDILIGEWQCDGGADTQPQCTPFEWSDDTPATDQPMCDGLLANFPGYLVNVDLTRRVPPPVPDDEALWPYFLYIGPETLETRDHPDALAQVPNSRRVDFERHLMQLCPTERWLVVMVDYVTAGVFDDSFDASFE